uniref:Uncharacterized protein n=1 Tax=Oryza barthii TaxID=65489 RepID=A0A0D3H567_9ORYZ
MNRIELIEPGTLHSVQPLPCFMGWDHSAVPISSLDLSSNVVSPGDQIIRMRDEILHTPTDVEGIWKNPLHTAAIAHAPNPATVTVVRAHRKLPSLCAPAQNFAPRGGGREQLCHRASPQSLPPPHSSLLSLLSRHERTTSRWELPLDLRRRRAAEAEVVVICSGPTDSTKAAGEGDDAGERRSLETAETGGSATVRGSLSAAAASRLLRVEGHDRRGRAVDAAGNSSRCRVPTLIYPRRGGDRDDSLDFSPSGRRSP